MTAKKKKGIEFYCERHIVHKNGLKQNVWYDIFTQSNLKAFCCTALLDLDQVFPRMVFH